MDSALASYDRCESELSRRAMAIAAAELACEIRIGGFACGVADSLAESIGSDRVYSD
jgi:hypothetical protein